MTRGLKLSLIVIGAVLAIGFLIIAGIWYKTFGPGLTMLETARILVQDDKFGMRAKDRAIRYGDAILPLLISESRDFKQLNWRNSFWIADVLGRIRTSRSRRNVSESVHST
jgi:hypothetical protein